jgi:hypothetical protein
MHALLALYWRPPPRDDGHPPSEEVVTVDGAEQALTGVRASRGYRRAIVAQRVLAIAFLVPFAALVVTGSPAVLYVCVALGIAGAVLAWAVVGVLAVRLARRPDGRFDPAELVPLAARYFHDLLGLRA